MQLTTWLAEVFSHPDLLGALSIAAKTLVIYLLVVLGMRLIGTRQLGELTTYDFVLLVVLANAVQNALVGGDTTLLGGLISAATLLLANAGFTWVLGKVPWLQRRLIGEPVTLVVEGKMDSRRMEREGVTKDELMAALREHGIANLSAVRLATLEVDGMISVVLREATTNRPRHRIRGLKTS